MTLAHSRGAAGNQTAFTNTICHAFGIATITQDGSMPVTATHPRGITCHPRGDAIITIHGRGIAGVTTVARDIGGITCAGVWMQPLQCALGDRAACIGSAAGQRTLGPHFRECRNMQGDSHAEASELGPQLVTGECSSSDRSRKLTNSASVSAVPFPSSTPTKDKTNQQPCI